MAPAPRAPRSVPSPFWTLVARVVVLLATLLVALGCRDGTTSPAPRPPGGTITSLSDADTILVTDLTGTLLAETSGTGQVRGRFAAYPFGVARRDESAESHQYAASPRDDTVALDHMGARFYAPDLGVWTSPDPLAVTGPEKLVTADFAAANAYAYARQSPLLAADRDGHFWHVAIGAAVGALMGGGMEAGRQYFAEGRVTDWGRVGAAAAGGGVAGAITAAVPTAGLASTLGANAGGNVIGGVTERIIASGGQSAGTLGDVAMDAAGSLAGDGVAKGAGAAVKRVGERARAVLRTPKPGGVEVYRRGTFEDSTTGWGGNFIKGRQWATDSPVGSADFAQRYGLPAENSREADWVVKGRLRGTYSTRPAPAGHDAPENFGGATEVLPDNPDDVVLESFHMPE